MARVKPVSSAMSPKRQKRYVRKSILVRNNGQVVKYKCGAQFSIVPLLFPRNLYIEALLLVDCACLFWVSSW
jgi:hypothetical protein